MYENIQSFCFNIPTTSKIWGDNQNIYTIQLQKLSSSIFSDLEDEFL
jgi:hypothetical protein